MMAASDDTGIKVPGLAATNVDLPPWAQASGERRAHTARVCRLLDDWALALGVSADERHAWLDAGKWHDALRDAPTDRLRAIVGDDSVADHALHGHAAAILLERGGERRAEVLEAVRWHTTGCRGWRRTGKALYMADFLEPGRRFANDETRALAAHVPAEFESAYARVLDLRRERIGRKTAALPPDGEERQS